MANGRKLTSQAPSTRAANPLHAPPTPTTTAASVRPAGERDRHESAHEAEAAQAASAAQPTRQRQSPQSFSSRANTQKTAMHKAEALQTSLAKEMVGGTEPGQRGASALRQGLASTTPATSTAYPAPLTASAPGKHPAGKVTRATQQVAEREQVAAGGISRLVKGRREERREQRAASAAARPARLAASVGWAAGVDGSAPPPRSVFKRGDTVETIVAL